MSIVDRPIEKPLRCSCGYTVKTMSTGHGRTPYMLHCHGCKLDLHSIMPSGVGWGQGEAHALEAWDDHRGMLEYFDTHGIRKPTEAQQREYWYREFKGWGQNPRTPRYD